MIRLRRGGSAADHDRARELAAQRIDEPLPDRDGAWLEAHLAGCDACRAVADEYAAQRLSLRALRGSEPVPPRDLWARTAAAIESEPARGASGARGDRRFGRNRLAPAAGLLAIVLIFGVGLLNGSALLLAPAGSPGTGTTALATPFAMAAGDIQVLTRGNDGALNLTTSRIESVCPVSAAGCASSTPVDSTQVAHLSDLQSFDAFLSPSRDRIVVMERGTGPQGVYVVPVGATVTATTTPTASPAPTAVATPAATPKPTLSTASVTASPTAPSASPATASPTPSASTAPAESPSASPVSTAASPAPTPSPSDAATASPDGSPAASPTPTPSDSTPATTAPSATPEAASPSPSVAVTPLPDGTIEIARDVIVVGSVSAYSPDGTRFAFTARPADGSTGPDVYVWKSGDAEARAVTTDHRSLFASWLGDDLLVSRLVDGKPKTSVVDPADGTVASTIDRSMWRPVVGPGGKTAVWWDGTVKRSADGFSWQPGAGQLVLGTWPADGSEPQVLASEGVRDWQVRWDESGKALALWTSDGVAGHPGELSMYAVNPTTGAVDLAKPMLSGERAFDGFSLRTGRLAWSGPDEHGDTVVKVLAWSGDTIGQLQILTEDGVTVVR